MRRFTTVLAVTFAVLATPAFADDLSQSIPFTQADRQDPAAAAALYDRVSITAKTLCAKANPSIYGFAYVTARARQACEREAIDNAVSHAAMPSLAAVHAQTLAQQQPATRPMTVASR